MDHALFTLSAAVSVDQKAVVSLDYTKLEQRIEFAVEDRSHTFDIPIKNDDVVETSAEMFRVDLYVHEQNDNEPYTCTFVQIEDDDGTYIPVYLIRKLRNKILNSPRLDSVPFYCTYPTLK